MTSTDLKQRVAEQAAGAVQSGSAPGSPSRSTFGEVNDLLVAMVPEFARALPRHMTAERLARIALTEVRRTPLLARCSRESLAGALLVCAQMGLEPGPAGEVYLLPFKNRRTGTYEVTLVVGYKGMAKLYWQSPLARSLDFQAVHENDEFDYEYGLRPQLRHKPTLTDRGEAIAYYACATFGNDGSAFVVLSVEDVNRIRERSKAKDDGPWKTDYDAMAKKTALRQLFKLLPQSPELVRATEVDDRVVSADRGQMGEFVIGELDVDQPRELETVQAAEPAEGEASEPEFDPVTGEQLPDADYAGAASGES